MKEILVPLDGSEHAELALPWAGRLAESLGFGLCLVATHPADEEMWAAAHIDMTAELSHRRQWLEQYLELTAAKVQETGVSSIRWEVREGDVNARLRDAIKEPETSLVAIATSGKAGFQGIPSTSVTDRLVRARLKPVAVIPQGGSKSEGNGIVVPLDGSKAAEEALALARELASSGSLPLHLVHVVDASPGWALPEDAQQKLQASLKEWGQSYLASTAGPSETTAVLIDPVVDAVFEYAREKECSYVVLGTHGRSGPERLELGSIADAMVRAADRPLVLVPVSD